MWLHGDEQQESSSEVQTSVPLWRNTHDKVSKSLMTSAEVEPEGAGSGGSELAQPKAKNYCKVISLQIPLPSNDRAVTEKTSLPREAPKYSQSPARTATARLNIKQLQFLLFGEEQKANVSCPTKLPMEPLLKPALHLSYKELAAAFGRVRPPWELRGPHPSVQYPNLCLLSRKAVSCPNTNGQTFRYTQGKSNKAETMHAAAELMPLPVLSPVRFNNGGATSGSQLELTSSSIVVKGDSKLGGRPHLTHLPCCICRSCATHRSKKQATYLDPLVNGPSGYHRRLTEITILVSDTIRVAFQR
eukprot:Em0023g210a